MTRFRLTALLLLVLALPAAVAQAAVRKPRASVGTTITVQQGIGALRPGISERRVRQLLGRPDKAGRRVDVLGGTAPTSLSYERKYGLLVFFDFQRDGAPVAAVVATHRQFRTAEGVRVGGTLSQIRRAYPALPMPCSRRADGARGRICVIRPDPNTSTGTSDETQFVFRGTRIEEIGVSSRIR